MAFSNKWAPYVPVAQRRANAARQANKLSKKGAQLRPIQIRSRTIAASFWGMAWCENLENYADWANRLPRGRTYARNGTIVDLQIEPGQISALVSGSSLYRVKVSIKPINKKSWQSIRGDCARQVNSLIDLMRGKLPEAVLARLTDPERGMFPRPRELKLRCSCPDSASLCKHLAATLYGVGHLLDSEPELFFKMRGVEQTELISDALQAQVRQDAIGLEQHSDLASEDLSAIFGIDLAPPSEVMPKRGRRKKPKTTKKTSPSRIKPIERPKSKRKASRKLKRPKGSRNVKRKSWTKAKK